MQVLILYTNLDNTFVLVRVITGLKPRSRESKFFSHPIFLLLLPGIIFHIKEWSSKSELLWGSQLK